MNAGTVALRRQVLVDLQRSKLAALRGRDYATADWLTGVITRHKQRLAYAEKMAAKPPRCFTPEKERFATLENRPDNARPAGGAGQ